MRSLTKVVAVNYAEIARFMLTGLMSALASMAAVWLVCFYFPYETALLAGIAAGISVSFSLSKWFAFNSPSWDRAPGEAARFVVVYGVGCAIYWYGAVEVSRVAQSHGGSAALAEVLGIIGGGGAMAVATYLGHRFFTYRTHKRFDGVAPNVDR